MNEKQLNYVITLAEKGSFSRAADELGMTQPSLSQFIKRTEKELNITLFDRTGSNVRLTDAGRIYIQTGKKILDAENEMKNRFSDLRENKIGTLKVGIAPTRCQYLMPEVVKRFAEKYPGMHLIIEERFLGNLVDDAEHGEFDLCVATLPVDKEKFKYDLMMSEEIVLAVPKTFSIYSTLQANQTIDSSHLYPVIDVKLINSSDYVCLSETQPTQVLLNEFCSRYNISIRVAVKCMSIETQFSMVKNGVGIALIPSSLAKYSDIDDVGYFSIEQTTPVREMAVIYRKDQYLSKATMTLKEIMTSV